MHLTPGDPAALLAGPEADELQIQAIRQKLGLDRPLHVQFFIWFFNMLRGDFGDSIFFRQPVMQAIADRIEPTLMLTLLSMLLACAIGIPSGVVAAVRQNTIWDQLLMSTALLGVTVPSFWLLLNMILLFSVRLRWFPVAGYVFLQQDPIGMLRTLALPALTLGLSSAGLIARMTRSMILEVLREDYIRTARSKGLPERGVIYLHALRNAMIPVVTVIGLAFGSLMAGAIIVETVAAIPGIGRLLVQSVFRRDYPVIQGLLMFSAGIYVLVNLAVDVAYGYLDPRVKYQ